MNFAQAANQISSLKLTENGALAFNNTGQGALYDFYSVLGALRNKCYTEEGKQFIREKFKNALKEDKIHAIRALFYMRDVRGGLGERETFRICLNYLGNVEPDLAKQIIKFVPFYGRWDDLYSLFDTPAESATLKFLYGSFCLDVYKLLNNEPFSLLAKWLKSENTSSKNSRKIAKKIINCFFEESKGTITPKSYRILLSKMREHLRVVEKQMSANDWESIKYENVPSNAMHNYYKAFQKHCGENFKEYLKEVNEGKKQIKAKTLYPYNIFSTKKHKYTQVDELQWKNLPNYVQDKNYLVLADFSPSMWRMNAIDISVSLAVYFAQRNKGAFHNLFLAFGSKPRYVKLKDNYDLNDCHVIIDREITNCGYSTNLNKAFKFVLNTLILGKVPQEEVPEAIIVISDMEIDMYFRNAQMLDFYSHMKKEFEDAGYKIPKLVLWNVQNRNDTCLSQNPEVCFVSGASPSVFKDLCLYLKGFSGYDLMMKILNSDRYNIINV